MRLSTASGEASPVYIDLRAADAEELVTLLTNAIYTYRLYTDVQLDALYEQA